MTVVNALGLTISMTLVDELARWASCCRERRRRCAEGELRRLNLLAWEADFCLARSAVIVDADADADAELRELFTSSFSSPTGQRFYSTV